MLQRREYPCLIRERGGLVDTREKVSAMLETAHDVCAAGPEILLDFITDDYQQEQVAHLYAIMHNIASTGKTYAIAKTIDPRVDNAEREISLAIGLALLEQKGIVAAVHKDDEFIATLPVQTITEIRGLIAARRGPCHD